MNSPSSIFEMPQLIVVGPAFFRNFKILFLALYLPPYAHVMPWTKLSIKQLFGFSTMLSHFNLCLVKTAKTAFETFHTPVNHCEI
jgi:membrane-anchored protein YejM (alkaline phosphatase superfamily)